MLHILSKANVDDVDEFLIDIETENILKNELGIVQAFVFKWFNFILSYFIFA